MPRKTIQMDITQRYQHPNVPGLSIPGGWLKNPHTLRIRKEGKLEKMTEDSAMLLEVLNVIRSKDNAMWGEYPSWRMKQKELNDTYRTLLLEEQQLYQIPQESRRKKNNPTKIDTPDLENESVVSEEHDIAPRSFRRESVEAVKGEDLFATDKEDETGRFYTDFTPINKKQSSVGNEKPSSVSNEKQSFVGNEKPSSVSNRKQSSIGNKELSTVNNAPGWARNPFACFRGQFVEGSEEDISQSPSIASSKDLSPQQSNTVAPKRRRSVSEEDVLVTKKSKLGTTSHLNVATNTTKHSNDVTPSTQLSNSRLHSSTALPLDFFVKRSQQLGIPLPISSTFGKVSSFSTGRFVAASKSENAILEESPWISPNVEMGSSPIKTTSQVTFTPHTTQGNIITLSDNAESDSAESDSAESDNAGSDNAGSGNAGSSNAGLKIAELNKMDQWLNNEAGVAVCKCNNVWCDGRCM